MGPLTKHAAAAAEARPKKKPEPNSKKKESKVDRIDRESRDFWTAMEGINSEVVHPRCRRYSATVTNVFPDSTLP